MGEDKKEIVLKVAREVADYFQRRKLIANQVIEKELEDGGLILSAKVPLWFISLKGAINA